MDVLLEGGGQKGYVGPPLKILGGGGLPPAPPPSTYAYDKNPGVDKFYATDNMLNGGLPNDGWQRCCLLNYKLADLHYTLR